MMLEDLPKELVLALRPLLETIAELTQRIREYERKLEEIATEHYPETQVLRQVEDIGTLTALTFVLVLEDPHRFLKSQPWEHTWDSFRVRTIRERAILSNASRSKAMRC
jgi:transposase